MNSGAKSYSIIVFAKIKEMLRSFVYDIHVPQYVTMGFEKWYTSFLFAQCEEICEFEIQNHAN